MTHEHEPEPELDVPVEILRRRCQTLAEQGVEHVRLISKAQAAADKALLTIADLRDYITKLEGRIAQLEGGATPSA